VIALILYSQLPIIRNTYTAIMNVDPALREAARGMGMTTLQRLREVELPIALPVIINGVRNAVVLNIAIGAIAPISAPAGSAPSSRAASRRPTSASSSRARSRSACSPSWPIMRCSPSSAR
jgi:ABC-type proline/glycine betaine transport system permease subunit